MSAGRSRPADWDAATYSRVSSPQKAWSGAVVDRLELVGHETVLDAGCGSGDVTASLLELLPCGRVIAVDASPSMADATRRRLPEDRAEVLHRDLTELDLDSAVDHAFSNAVFHWIADHETLFSGLHRAIRPGGKLIAQFGGKGNVVEMTEALEVVCAEEPFVAATREFATPWHFPGPDETKARLIAAGFTKVECWLEEQTARPEEPQAFLEASVLAPVREALEADLFAAFSDRMMEVMGQPESFQYVRLNIDAVRD